MRLPKVIEFRLKDDVSREGLERLRVQVRDMQDAFLEISQEKALTDEQRDHSITRLFELQNETSKLSWIDNYDKATLRIEKLEIQMRNFNKSMKSFAGMLGIEARDLNKRVGKVERKVKTPAVTKKRPPK